jgi:hypothetical protein
MPTAAFSRRALVICAALALALPAFAETVRGNGVIRTQARSVTGFHAIGLGSGARVEVKQGETESVTVEADENLLPLIETKVDGGELEIKPVRRNLSLESKSIRIVVQAKQVDALAVGGSGTIASDAIKSAKLQLEVGGSGTIDLKRADAERVSIQVGGSGDVNIGGAAKRVAIEIGGSGNVDGAKLVSDEAQVTIAGSGDTSVGVRNELQVTIAGSGGVNYTGDPKVRSTVVGSGRIKRVGALAQ